MIAFESWWNVTRKSRPEVASPNPRPYTPEDVFHIYAGRVYHLARRLLDHEADAQDVTQDVLLQVVRKLDTFRGESGLATWLHRVTVNAVLAHRRQKAHRSEWLVGSPLVQAPSTGDQVINRETRELIERAIVQLPPIYRTVLILADVEQLTNPAIAKVLGLSVPAVKSRLHRARQLMRESLTSLDEPQQNRGSGFQS